MEYLPSRLANEPVQCKHLSPTTIQCLNVRFVHVSTGLDQMLGIVVSGFIIHRVENGRWCNSRFPVVLCFVNTEQWM